MGVSRTKLRLLCIISILTFAPCSMASDSLVFGGVGFSDSAATVGTGLQVDAREVTLDWPSRLESAQLMTAVFTVL